MAYTPAQITDSFNLILERIERGESLRTILKDSDMPSTRTFYKWLESDELLVKQYARACELRAENLFDEIIDIADDSSGDIKYDKDGNPYLDNEFVQRSRVRIDARKWVLGKLNPKKFSDKVTLQGDADNPIQSKLTIEVLPASGRIASSESDIDD
jgi:hypothetical protein